MALLAVRAEDTDTILVGRSALTDHKTVLRIPSGRARILRQKGFVLFDGASREKNIIPGWSGCRLGPGPG